MRRVQEEGKPLALTEKLEQGYRGGGCGRKGAGLLAVRNGRGQTCAILSLLDAIPGGGQ